MEYTQNLILKVRKYKLHLTQTEFSKVLFKYGLGRLKYGNIIPFRKSDISRWENGESIPHREIIRWLANYLNVGENEVRNSLLETHKTLAGKLKQFTSDNQLTMLQVIDL